jgi:hypothetical protein
MNVGTWLERFRRPAGVPAAAGEGVGPELTPVFAALDEIERAAEAVRQRTARDVAERLEAAHVEAEHVRRTWERRAEAERERAEAERRAELRAEAQAIEAAAQLEAERVHAIGLQRLPSLVTAVVAAITEERV